MKKIIKEKLMKKTYNCMVGLKKQQKNLEKNLQLYGRVKKATEKLMNQVSKFEKLECDKSLNINQ